MICDLCYQQKLVADPRSLKLSMTGFWSELRLVFDKLVDWLVGAEDENVQLGLATFRNTLCTMVLPRFRCEKTPGRVGGIAENPLRYLHLQILTHNGRLDLGSFRNQMQMPVRPRFDF